MTLKQFLKPDWRKGFIILFLVFINFFYVNCILHGLDINSALRFLSLLSSILIPAIIIGFILILPRYVGQKSKAGLRRYLAKNVDANKIMYNVATLVIFFISFIFLLVGEEIFISAISESFLIDIISKFILFYIISLFIIWIYDKRKRK